MGGAAGALADRAELVGQGISIRLPRARNDSRGAIGCGRSTVPSVNGRTGAAGWEVRARARARKLYAPRARRTARAVGPARGARGTFDIVGVHLLVFSSLVDVGHGLVG
jgi:hypothetical protein